MSCDRGSGAQSQAIRLPQPSAQLWGGGFRLVPRLPRWVAVTSGPQVQEASRERWHLPCLPELNALPHPNSTSEQVL